MICETCHGVGLVAKFRAEGALKSLLPCPDCIGGVRHCCEGERPQPEPETKVD